jgi:hypothetical protein
LVENGVRLWRTVKGEYNDIVAVSAVKKGRVLWSKNPDFLRYDPGRPEQQLEKVVRRY